MSVEAAGIDRRRIVTRLIRLQEMLLSRLRLIAGMGDDGVVVGLLRVRSGIVDEMYRYSGRDIESFVTIMYINV